MKNPLRQSDQARSKANKGWSRKEGRCGSHWFSYNDHGSVTIHHVGREYRIYNQSVMERQPFRQLSEAKKRVLELLKVT